MKRVLAAIPFVFAVAADAVVVEPEDFVNLVQTTSGKYVCDNTGAWYDGKWATLDDRHYTYDYPNPDMGRTVDSCITFGDNRIVVNAYRFHTAESSTNTRSPKRWKFYGRRFPGDDWILLDERKDEPALQTGVWKTYSFQNEIACSAFKFVFTEKQGGLTDLFSLYEISFHYVERTDELAVRGNAPMIDGVGHYDLAVGDTVTIEAPASPAANPATGDRYTLQGFRIVDFAGNEVATGTPDDLPYTYTHEGAYRRFEWIWDGQYEALAETLNVDVAEPSVTAFESVADYYSSPAKAFDEDFANDGYKWLHVPSAANPCWFSCRFSTGRRSLKAFKLYQNVAKRYLVGFEFQGSNDGENWTTLHQVSQASVDDSRVHGVLCRFNNCMAFDRYRFLIAESRAEVQIDEAELFDHDVPDALRITGFPRAEGRPAPFYGYEMNLADGQEIVCTAPTEEIQVGDEHLTAIGYQLRVGGELGEVVNETTCAYRHTAGTAAELQWIFGVKTSQRVEVKGNGTVEPAEFSAEDGEEVTVTATPGANSFFAYWEGDVPEGKERDPVLTFTVQGKMDVAAVFGTTYHVKPDGDDAADGLSRATAFATMPHALAVAANADKVVVASGIYEMPDATIEIEEPITLVSEEGPDATILQATGEKHRILYANNAKFLMDGFTLTGGEAADDSAGALRLVAGTATNCIFRGNKSTAKGGRGGAVFVASANALLTCSVVTNNSSAGDGGGVFVLDGRIERCLVAGNSAAGRGGGVAGLNAGGGVVSGCTIRNCTAKSPLGGGGVYLIHELVDSVVENCSAPRGGGLSDVSVVSHCVVTGCGCTGGSGAYLGGGGAYSEATPMAIDNTLFTGNTASAAGGGGAIGSKYAVALRNVTIVGNKGVTPAVALYNTARLSAVNSIVACNSDSNDVTNGPSCLAGAGETAYPAFAKLDHSCVFDDSFDAAVAEWSIRKDPLFNLGAHKDLPYWSLRGVSPCRNAGAKLDYTADDVDLAGRPRVVGRPDMGCYESASVRLAVMVK